MEFLSAIPVIGEPLSILIPFLVVLGVVVFVHEYGHYIVGRWCGIKAEVFSIGFGPRLYGWRDRWGTEWQLAALPLGGFVRFAGDMDPASAGRIEDHHLSEASRREAFHNAPLWARAATVIAGPAFNFVLSIALFAAVGLAVGKQSNLPIIGSVETEAAQGIAFEAGDEVLRLDGAEIDSFAAIQDTIQRADGRPVEAVVMRDGEEVSFEVSYRRGTEINQVTPGLPAFGAGMLPGDRIVSLNGAVVDSFFELQTAVADLPLSDLVTLEVEREGETLSFSFEPEVVTASHPVTGEQVEMPRLGVGASGAGGIAPSIVSATPLEALESGVERTFGIVTGTVNVLRALVFENADASNLGGPIRIAQISGEQAEQGVGSLLILIAYLSTSIGFLNLMPIPVLDGGHLMFYIYEAMRGKPAGAIAIKYGSLIGLSLVLMLMVFATYNDIARLL